MAPLQRQSAGCDVRARPRSIELFAALPCRELMHWRGTGMMNGFWAILPSVMVAAFGDEGLAIAVLGATPEAPPPGFAGKDLAATVRYASDESQTEEALRGVQAVFAWDFRPALLQKAWGEADSLRWIHVACVGVDGLLFKDLVDSDVVVTNSRGVFDLAMAEYAAALMLAFSKSLPETLRLQHDCQWQHRDTELLAAQRLVVVGVGGIGRAVARVGRSLGMRVVAVGRTARHDPELGDVEAVTHIADVVGDADYVVLATPLTEQTRHLVGKSVLERMQPTARLINLARGDVVDENELLEAIREKRIAGAALDVFAEEPLPRTHPFWMMDEVIVSPHMSADAAGCEAAISELFLDNLRRWTEGAPLRNVVDKHLGFVPTAAS